MCACMLSHFSHVRLFAALWTIAHQAPLSMVILQARILVWRKGNPLFSFFSLLSIVVVPIYITTNSVGGFPFLHILSNIRFPGGSVVKNLPANAGDGRDTCSIPVLGRFPWKRNPLQCSCWICRLQSIVFQRVRQD